MWSCSNKLLACCDWLVTLFVISAKKKNKKGKTLTLTDFLAEDSGGTPVPSYPPKSTSWADETDDLDGDSKYSSKDTHIVFILNPFLLHKAWFFLFLKNDW